MHNDAFRKEKMAQKITVSIIIPVYNESKYIIRCLDSVKRQTVPAENTELLIIDGNSTDDTVSKIRNYTGIDNLRILINEKRLVTYALNIGIDNARGEYVIRMDAHAEYADDYVEKCVYYLEHTDADNVGGTAETRGISFAGQANAELLSSKFGVGNSNFRTGGKSGYVDTVPFGAFRRTVFSKIGYFDPELPRSEDNDYNSRIRAAGGKVYLASDIHFTYYCRDTAGGLLDQGIKNGNALFLTLRKNPRAMSLRHYIPFLFVLSHIVMPVLCAFFHPAVWLYAAEWIAYLLLDAIFSLSRGSLKRSLYKFVMYPLFHISYGIGSLIGMFGIKLY